MVNLPARFDLVNQNLKAAEPKASDHLDGHLYDEYILLSRDPKFTIQFCEAIAFLAAKSKNQAVELLNKVTLDMTYSHQCVLVSDALLKVLGFQVARDFILFYISQNANKVEFLCALFGLFLKSGESNSWLSEFLEVSAFHTLGGQQQKMFMQRLLQMKNFEEVLQIESLLHQSDLFYLRAAALYGLGKSEEALQLLEKNGNSLHEDDSALLCYANILKNEGKYDVAGSYYCKLAKKFPSNFAILEGCAFCSLSNGAFREAIAFYKACLDINPDHVKTWINLGISSQYLKDETEYRCYETALKLDPSNYRALIGLAHIHLNNNDLINAEKVLGAINLSKEKPGPEYYINLSVVAGRRHDLEAMYGHLSQGLKYFPDDPLLLEYMGIHFRTYYDLKSSSAFLDKALLSEAARPSAHFERFRNAIAEFNFKKINAFMQSENFTNPDVDPITCMYVEDDGIKQLERAKKFSQKFSTKGGPIIPLKPKSVNKKVNLAYFSADFHSHATMHLIAGFFKNHNLEKFNIYLLSNGPTRDDEYQNLCKSFCTEFLDISELPDERVFDWTDSLDLDIAIDLKGYTKDSRQSLFARRLAPRQVSYLGYPGTSGADYMDYIIADKMVVRNENYFSEKVLYLPNSYQCNDNERMLPLKKTTKRDNGLPTNSFVFASFNNPTKICEDTWTQWVLLLQACPDSVLWLLVNDDDMKNSLKTLCADFGLCERRIVFAERTTRAIHLERHFHVDLMLDTFKYNAHTTASDALWMATPFVTLKGDSFASRVGASLLKACNLEHLIAGDVHSWRELCIKFYNDRSNVGLVRTFLDSNRNILPLFNTIEFTRDFEKLLCDLAST